MTAGGLQYSSHDVACPSPSQCVVRCTPCRCDVQDYAVDDGATVSISEQAVGLELTGSYD